MMDAEALKSEVWEHVQRMNRLWTEEGRAQDLEGYFAEDMVAITPTDRYCLEGRAACVAGWSSFASAAEILRWKEIEPRIQLLAEGRVAVVSYYYDIVFEISGRRIEQGGRDMFVLEKRDGRWWAVADQFSSFPAAG